MIASRLPHERFRSSPVRLINGELSIGVNPFTRLAHFAIRILESSANHAAFE